MEYLFGQFGSVVLAMSPSNLLLTSSLLAFGEQVWRDSLDAVQELLSSSQKIGVLSTSFYLKIQRTTL